MRHEQPAVCEMTRRLEMRLLPFLLAALVFAIACSRTAFLPASSESPRPWLRYGAIPSASAAGVLGWSMHVRDATAQSDEVEVLESDLRGIFYTKADAEAAIERLKKAGETGFLSEPVQYGQLPAAPFAIEREDLVKSLWEEASNGVSKGDYSAIPRFLGNVLGEAQDSVGEAIMEDRFPWVELSQLFFVFAFFANCATLVWPIVEEAMIPEQDELIGVLARPRSAKALPRAGADLDGYMLQPGADAFQGSLQEDEDDQLLLPPRRDEKSKKPKKEDAAEGASQKDA